MRCELENCQINALPIENTITCAIYLLVLYNAFTIFLLHWHYIFTIFSLVVFLCIISQLAAQNGYADIIKLLVESGRADVQERNTTTGKISSMSSWKFCTLRVCACTSLVVIGDLY